MKLRYKAYSLKKGVYKVKTTTAMVLSAIGLVVGGGGSLAIATFTTASAATNTIYNNIPSPLPGNLPSQAFEATSTSEFGGQVAFAGTERENPTITVLMSSWGCQSGNWYTADTPTCVTTPGATFSEPVTLNVYNVNPDGSVGAQITSVTQTFNIPYRPSSSTNCTGPNSGSGYNGTGQNGKWYNAADDSCNNGFATPISFDLAGTTLPSAVIISVAYNTSHYGSTPYGEATTCFVSSGGCGYDSLNVALNTVNATPTVGADPKPDSAYLKSTYGGTYCDNGVSGTGIFRLDSGCWTGYQPAFKVTASSATPNVPTTKDQCMNNGWKNFQTKFKNQGDCVSFVATGGKNQPSAKQN